MKPILLSHPFSCEPFDPKVSNAWIKKVLSHFGKDGTESVEVCPVFDDQMPFFDRYKQFLSKKGYAFRKNRNMYSQANDGCEFDFVKGSVGAHTDKGYGLSSGCLLYKAVSKNPGITCELITRHGALPLGVGDVFVFNTDRWHAWVSNSDCLLAMMTIKKKSKSL